MALGTLKHRLVDYLLVIHDDVSVTQDDGTEKQVTVSFPDIADVGDAVDDILGIIRSVIEE